MAPANIAIVYYSLYGHIQQLVTEAKKGAEATGAKVTVFQL